VSGLARFLVLTAAAAGVFGGAGLLFGLLADGDLGEWLAIGLLFGGAILIVFGGYSVAAADFGLPDELRQSTLGNEAKRQRRRESAALAAMGVTLIALGFLAETTMGAGAPDRGLPVVLG
jgi:hypothetical protein